MVALTALTLTAHAQDASDALRISSTSPMGTARSIGYGNALGSIGGDFSSMSVNPAGIGIYRKSEFTFTPSMTFSNTDAAYNPNGTGFGPNRSDHGQHFAISNIGFVFTASARGSNYDTRDWKSASFGIGMNRIADFTRNYSYGGSNDQSSGSWVFEIDANNNPDNINRNYTPAYLGYQSYLLDTATLNNGNAGYLSVINPSAGNPVSQLMSVKERGGISEYFLSWGGNYKDKLMLGATLGLPYMRYIRELTYQESDPSGDNNNSFANYTYTNDLRTTGLGVNLKLGLIYKPVEFLRIGGAIHTPTWYRLHDVQNIGITANTENFGGINNVSNPENRYDYNVSTPWKALASASVLFNKYGFLTADVEYVDYRTTRFRFDDQDRAYEQYINNQTDSLYSGAVNFRIGAEVKLDIVSLRAGFGYYGNPYKESVYKDGQRYDYSAGIGFRLNHTFIDLGFIRHQYKNEEQTYNTYANVFSPVAKLRTSQSNAVVTVGWKF